MRFFVAFVVVALGVVILVSGVRGTYANVFRSITSSEPTPATKSSATTTPPADTVLASAQMT